MTKASETRICFWRFFYCRGIRHERKGGISMDVMKAVESLQSDLWGVWFLIGAALVLPEPKMPVTSLWKTSWISVSELWCLCWLVFHCYLVKIILDLLVNRDLTCLRTLQISIFQRLYLTLCSVQQRQQSFPEQWQRELSSCPIVYTQQWFQHWFIRLKPTGFGAAAG